MNDSEAVLLEGGESWVRLSIVQYQFPQTDDDEWDSNWLVVMGRACVSGRQWQFKEPCLTTFEAQRLANWMASHYTKEADRKRLAKDAAPLLEITSAKKVVPLKKPVKK